MMLSSWSSTVQAEAVARLARPDLGRWLGQVQQVRHCSRPVRLAGGSDTIDPATGEIVGSYASAAEPDGVTYVRCGNRRASVCPSCSHEYKGDVWHLLMAGAAGGIKDVPDTVAAHPLVFATLTAPSFGLVHAAKKPGRPGSRRCLPRSSDRRQLCEHGRPRWCMAVHDHLDPVAGQPLCPDCYDYQSHLVWQWYAPELWRRFTITLRRRIAAHLGLNESAARERVRVQFAKVAEFQRRGIVHFHALIRLDGPAAPDHPYPTPAVQIDSRILSDLVLSAAGSVWCEAAPVDQADTVRLLRFGGQVDARPVHGGADRDMHHGAELHPQTVAAYIAKYATKAAADLPTSQAGGHGHLRRLKTTVQQLHGRAMVASLNDTENPYAGWGRWSDMLGFRGHFASKSRRYSITLGRLRQARRDYTRRRTLTGTGDRAEPSVWVGEDQAGADDSTLVVGSWRFAGMGWLTSGDAALAAASAARARDD